MTNSINEVLEEINRTFNEIESGWRLLKGYVKEATAELSELADSNDEEAIEEFINYLDEYLVNDFARFTGSLYKLFGLLKEGIGIVRAMSNNTPSLKEELQK